LARSLECQVRNASHTPCIVASNPRAYVRGEALPFAPKGKALLRGTCDRKGRQSHPCAAESAQPFDA